MCGRTPHDKGERHGSRHDNGGRPTLWVVPTFPARLPWPRRLATTVLLVPVLAACSAGAASSFAPGVPCTTDGQREGAYPELESLLPETFDEAPPNRRDSGRNCTDAALGTLMSHGINELQFAGALWQTGKRSGVTVAVFRAPGLTADQVTEFYESGARKARKTTDIQVRGITVDGVKGERLDALNDESYQSILVFDDAAPDTVRAVLVANDVREIETRQAHEAVVRRAAATALGSAAHP
jgi:hypothetical protein